LYNRENYNFIKFWCQVHGELGFLKTGLLKIKTSFRVFLKPVFRSLQLAVATVLCRSAYQMDIKRVVPPTNSPSLARDAASTNASRQCQRRSDGPDDAGKRDDDAIYMNVLCTFVTDEQLAQMGHPMLVGSSNPMLVGALQPMPTNSLVTEPVQFVSFATSTMPKIDVKQQGDLVIIEAWLLPIQRSIASLSLLLAPTIARCFDSICPETILASRIAATGCCE